MPLQLAADMPATVVFRSAADVRRELDQRGIDINSLASLTNDQSNLDDEPDEVEHLQSTPPTTSLN
jgi:sugar phosphate isomerase/epimerase